MITNIKINNNEGPHNNVNLQQKNNNKTHIFEQKSYIFLK